MKLLHNPPGRQIAFAVLAAVSLLTCTPKTEQEIERPLHQEEGKSASLEPNDYFMLDRNYPNTEVNVSTYQSLLQRAIAYDKQAVAQGRDLDHPWRLEGPGNIGGRVNAVAVHPENANIILLGYSQGGIWRTEDNGETWVPVFDDQPALSIAHIIFDPHDPSHMWAATGDVNISGYYWLGTGVYESFDTGLTWHYKGLSDTGILSKVVVDPNNPGILYVGSMGYPAETGNQRGLFRSVDGGDTWHKTLHVDDSTGIVDIVADPTVAGRIFAAAWTRIRSNVKGVTKGPGTGLYRSDDYGATWYNIKNGLPEGDHSRTGVEITTNGTLFMSYVGDSLDPDCGNFTEDVRGIYKSTDGGMTWDTISLDQDFGWPCVVMGGFGWYFEYLKVNPDNPLDIFILGVSMYRSLDGGVSWFEATPDWLSPVHADKHDLIFAHGQVYLGTDGGAYKTEIDPVGDWTDIENIPSTQFYRTAWSPHTPDQYYGGAQDNGTSGGNAAVFNAWPRIFGGDGFQPRFDPTEPEWMYALTQYGNVWFRESGNDFDWLSGGLTGTRYWDMPLLMDAFNPKILYCGSDRVFRIHMNDSIRRWMPISEDLTRGDTILGSRYPGLTALAQSPVDSLRLYAGTQDGFIWTSGDGGESWNNITEGTPGFFVTAITCSTVHPEAVYVTFSGYRDNDHQPYIYYSEDTGESWEARHTDLPVLGVNDLFIVPGTEDNTILVGTDGGVYLSVDGSGWQRVGNNMPYMPVYDIDYNPVEERIIAATFSRGIMTFPVEELEVDLTSSDETDISNELRVYPTVFDNHLIIDGLPDEAGQISVKLVDMSGQVVWTTSINSKSTVKLNVPHQLSSSVYMMQVLLSNDQVKTFKIVKK